MSSLKVIKEKLGPKIINIKEHNPARVYIDINSSDIREAVSLIFKDLNFRYITTSGVDTRDAIEMLYHFSEDKTALVVSIRTMIHDKKKPAIDSLEDIITGASWVEREINELLGVNFIGHKNLKHLLLGNDWPANTYPLRHDNE